MSGYAHLTVELTHEGRQEWSERVFRAMQALSPNGEKFYVSEVINKLIEMGESPVPKYQDVSKIVSGFSFEDKVKEHWENDHFVFKLLPKERWR